MRNTDMLLARAGADGVVRKYRTAGDWAGMVQRSFAGRAEPHLLSVPAVPLDALRCFRSKRVADDFAKHLLQANAQAENVNSTGGAVVPSGQVSDDLIALRDSAGITPKLCDVEEMASDTLTVPRLDSGFTATYFGDNTAASELSAVFSSVALTAKKLGCFAKASDEFLADAPNGADSIGADLMYRLAYGIDNAFCAGDGSSTYAGIEGLTGLFQNVTLAGAISAASGHSALTSLDSTDLGTLVGTLLSNAYQGRGISWLMHPIVWGSLFYRLASGGDIVESVNSRTYKGAPVYLSAAMPSGASTLGGKLVCCVGNFSEAATLGLRWQIKIFASSERFAEFDETMWLATTRFDVVVHDVGNATTAGPVVGLLAHS